MIHRYRRLCLLVGLVAGLLVAPMSALAAVDTDAVVTVKFVDAETLLPVDGAPVKVRATQGETVVAELEATTDDTGTAVVSAVPRETGDGEPVLLEVTAQKATVFTDEETGCVHGLSWFARRAGVVVDATAVAVEFNPNEQAPGSSLACPPGEPEPTQQVGGAVGTPGAKHTLPPTDALAAPAETAVNGAVVALGLVALAAAILFLTPRRRLARRGVRVRR